MSQLPSSLPPLGELEILWLGAFLGALVSGASGFGFSLAAVSLWLHRLSPVQTAVLATSCSVLLNAGMLWPLRRSIQGRRLAPFLVGGLLGVPAGVHLLAVLDVAELKVLLGTMLTLFGLYALLVRRLPVISAGGVPADVAVGAIGGVLGGLGGFSGVLPMIWTQLRGWPRDVSRGVYQPFILVAQIGTLGLILLLGMDRSGLGLIVLALPPLAAGSWIGWWLYGRMDQALFRKVVAAGVALSGLSLAL